MAILNSTKVKCSISVGEYENGIKNGYGEYKYGNGRVYQGNWVNGKQHGEGKLIVDGKEEFNGYFAGGKPLKTAATGNEIKSFHSSNIPPPRVTPLENNPDLLKTLPQNSIGNIG